MPSINQYVQRTMPQSSGTTPFARPNNAGTNPLADVAAILKDVTDAAQKRQDEAARAWAIDAVSRARLDWTGRLQEMQAGADLGAPEFTKRFVDDFDEYSTEALKAAPNDVARKYFGERLADIRTSLGEKAITFEAAARVDYRDTKFNTAIDNAQKTVAMDAGQFDVVLSETLAVIDSSALPPKARADMHQKAIENIASATIYSQIRKSPSAFLEQIGLASGPAKLINKDGSISTGETITVQDGNDWVVLPAVVDGVKHDGISAVAMWKGGEIAEVGRFSTQMEADNHAQLQSISKGGIGKTGIKAFDILPFDKRNKLVADAITLANQIDSEAERLSARERKQHSEDLMKEALSRLSPQQGQKPLDRQFVEQARPFVSSDDYKFLLKALKNGGVDGGEGPSTDPVAFRELQVSLYNDPEAARKQAVIHHRAGRISNSDLSSILTKAYELDRTGGPKTEYERTRQRIVGNLDPGPFVQDPAGRGRMAEALYEFDGWAESGKRTEAEISKRGEEIVKRYQLWDKSKVMPKPLSAKPSTDREKVLAPIGDKWNKAKQDRASGKISEAKYLEIAKELRDEWRRVEKQHEEKQ